MSGFMLNFELVMNFKFYYVWQTTFPLKLLLEYIWICSRVIEEEISLIICQLIILSFKSYKEGMRKKLRKMIKRWKY